MRRALCALRRHEGLGYDQSRDNTVNSVARSTAPMAAPLQLDALLKF